MTLLWTILLLRSLPRRMGGADDDPTINHVTTVTEKDLLVNIIESIMMMISTNNNTRWEC